MNAHRPSDTVALVLHFRDITRTTRCLDSLLADEVRRVMVVDNSQDGGASLAVLATRFGAWAGAGLEVDVQQPPSNLGFSAGANAGMKAIRAKYGRVCVLLLNSDATLRKGAHAAMRVATVGEPAVAAACMVSADGIETPSAYHQRLLGLLSRKAMPGAHRYLSGCCMMIHPELADGALFDEDFFFYGEDIELGWRLSGLGIAQLAVEHAKVDHEGSAGSRNGSLFYEYHLARAHLLLPRKVTHHRPFRIAMYLARSVTLPMRAMVRSLRLSSLAPWHGLALAVVDVVRGKSRSLTPPAA